MNNLMKCGRGKTFRGEVIKGEHGSKWVLLGI